MRKLGGIGKILPFTYSMMLLGSLALSGFPFLSGFYSKDLILEIAYSKSSFIGYFTYWLGALAAFLTSFYSFRLMYLTFITRTNSYKYYLVHINENSIFIALPLIFLSIGSIFGGFTCYSIFVEFGSNFWQNSIYIAPNNSNGIDVEFVPILIKQIPTFLSISAIFFVYFFYIISIYQLSISSLSSAYTFLNNKWFFDQIYNYYIAIPLFRLAYINCYKLIDKGFLELCGPFGISNFVSYCTKHVLSFQTGFIYNYICLFILTLFFFIFIIDLL